MGNLRHRREPLNKASTGFGEIPEKYLDPDGRAIFDDRWRRRNADNLLNTGLSFAEKAGVVGDLLDLAVGLGMNKACGKELAK